MWLNPFRLGLLSSVRRSSGDPHLISDDVLGTLLCPSPSDESKSVKAVPTESTVQPLDALDLRACDDAGDAADEAHDCWLDCRPPLGLELPIATDSAKASSATLWKKLSASS